MIQIFHYLILVSSIVNSFHLVSNRGVISKVNTLKMTKSEESENKFQKSLKCLPAVLGTACLLFLQPFDASAASSGGRSGGSSFKSSSSSSYRPSSSTRLNSYSSSSYGYASRPMISPMPIIVSPFSYGFGYNFIDTIIFIVFSNFSILICFSIITISINDYCHCYIYFK